MQGAIQVRWLYLRMRRLGMSKVQAVQIRVQGLQLKGSGQVAHLEDSATS